MRAAPRARAPISCVSSFSRYALRMLRVITSWMRRYTDILSQSDAKCSAAMTRKMSAFRFASYRSGERVPFGSKSSHCSCATHVMLNRGVSSSSPSGTQIW